MSAMAEFHHELTSAGIDPRTYEFDQVPAPRYISPDSTTVPTAATTSTVKAGCPTPTQETGRPAFFVSCPGVALMPTKRQTSHAGPTDSDPIDALLTIGQRTFGWLAAIGAAYLTVRAFIPFLWHLFFGGRQ